MERLQARREAQQSDQIPAVVEMIHRLGIKTQGDSSSSYCTCSVRSNSVRGFFTKRSVWLSLMAALLIVAGFSAYLTVGAHSTKAAPGADVHHAKAEPNLAKPGDNTPL